MGSKTDYGEAALLAYVFQDVDPGLSGYLYIALSTLAYSETATGSTLSELGTRATVSRSSGAWTISGTSPTTITNAAEIDFPATSFSGTVNSIYICDALSGGNVLYGSNLPATTVNAYDVPYIPAGQLTITED